MTLPPTFFPNSFVSVSRGCCLRRWPAAARPQHGGAGCGAIAGSSGEALGSSVAGWGGGGRPGRTNNKRPPSDDMTGPEEEEDDEFLDHPAPITAGVAVTALSLATSLARVNEYRRVNPLNGTWTREVAGSLLRGGDWRGRSFRAPVRYRSRMPLHCWTAIAVLGPYLHTLYVVREEPHPLWEPTSH